MNRRKVLSLMAAGLTSVLTALYAFPLVGQVFGPLRRREQAKRGSFSVGKLADFAPGEPTRVTFQVTIKDGWETKVSERSAWVIRSSDDAVRVFTSACPHLGCSVTFSSMDGEFQCPCHDARFARDGSLAEGPAERGLDALPVSVVAGEVRISWLEFFMGGEESIPRGGAVA